MRQRQFRYFMCDFETTVYKGQTNTEVWAGAIVELYTEDVLITHSIDETFDELTKIGCNIVAYFHNLKFDGSFWLDYLLIQKKFKQAYEVLQEDPLRVRWLNEKDMPTNSFKYSISARGQWYTFTIKTKGVIIEIRDSLKLLPFSVKRIGASFKTKHKKLDMEYEGLRYAGCEITDLEKEYIKNDVLVVKEALEILYNDGHNKLTIGSCCYSEYKKTLGKEDFDMFFPDVYEDRIDEIIFGADSVGAYCVKGYVGGWCYVVEGKAGKVLTNGITADVNSLYPSQMHSSSGNRYPVGHGKMWSGDFIPEEAKGSNKYYYIRVKTRFYLKEGHLPFIQIKNSWLYKGTECLKSSDVKDFETGEYYSTYIKDGKEQNTRVVLTFTMTMWELFKEHYELVDCEILDGCWFYSEIGLFDDYIDHYAEIKMNSEGAEREEAKLFLNNLYGKLASSQDSSFKVAYIKPDNTVGLMINPEFNKKPGYIPAGAAITSYARNFTIRHAQKNYHGPDKAGFAYADTDSIHCDNTSAEDLIDIRVDGVKFNHWKLESCWDEAYFERQKTYIEHVTHENMKPVKPYYNVKCAGMPDRCKQLFLASMGATEIEAKNEDEISFISEKRSITDFTVGLEVPSKLRPKRISGGVLLVDTTYKMR